MALAQRKKQDDKILKLLREVANLPGNKHCFDCGEKGTTYVNSTIGSFVCTTCSGLLRGLTPPHRIKSISMATFTQEEIDFLKVHGNEECAKTWLGLWDAKRAIKQDHRDFMIDKYERKRYYLEPASPLMSIPLGRQVAPNNNNNNNNNTSTNSDHQKADADNLAVLKSINFTPPSSLCRKSALSKNRPQANSTGSPIFKTVGPRAVNGRNNNGSTTTSNSSTGCDTTNNNNNGANKFTPDTDFVADFSKIDMFSERVPSTNVVNSNNNINGFLMLNGGDNSKSKIEQHNSTKNCNIGVMENFADFEHNQIYNAAEDPAQIFSIVNFLGNSSNPVQNTQNDFGAKSSTSTTYHRLDNNNSIFDFNFNNDNVSQQQQQQNLTWASFPNSCNNITPKVSSPLPPPESNLWSLPMSVGSISSLSSSNTFNTSSSSNSTPSVDKYAALKDLDEQFKEIKILGAVDTSTPTNPQNNQANPFKNPSLLQSALNASNNNTNQNLGSDYNKNGIASTNGWATQFPNHTQTNGNGFFANQNQSIFNTNAFMSTSNQMNDKIGGFNSTSSGTFGFGQANTFSNPFVAQAGTVNSNNPFL